MSFEDWLLHMCEAWEPELEAERFVQVEEQAGLDKAVVEVYAWLKKQDLVKTDCTDDPEDEENLYFFSDNFGGYSIVALELDTRSFFDTFAGSAEYN
ncbi:MAG: hypothetical protein QF486_00340 [Candidatus Woesearchaeota archaeon]|jgi:hypothetical protein|nr:hypothetical protein [Candidatus Woesearchaeota archaeon]MDP7181328.1 hypothetical protein [Candidatus Woesearchaeota archaeon]MDP7198053.1 hypothetical protein [Candidatus Woesearchaeota archaeon]MDP7466887.1 hypothetical protein [Candidatus Woesearchaeota archaeon]MDP7647323.1 hypothetical protein [Candidatus Woesearchaeota archaeon]